MSLERGYVFPKPRPKEDGLSCIGVSRPFVEYEYPGELSAVLDPAQQGVGNEIVHSNAVWIAWETGAEVPPGLNLQSLVSQRDEDFRILRQEVRRNADDRGLRGCQLQMLEKGGCDPFIDQDASMLRSAERKNGRPA